ncbi:MAG: hypothetical protein ACT4PI_04965 [Actinomycetota bacterium]
MKQMQRSDDAGFDRAEELEALVVEDPTRPHDEEVRDLVCLADFLVPELHRDSGPEQAAEAVTEWADGDPQLLAEAEDVARVERHDESAELLHLAVEVASAA